MMLFFQLSRIFIEVALFLVLQELGNTRQFQVNLVLENCRVCADGKLRDDRCKITFAVASWRPIHSRQVVCIRVYCRIRVLESQKRLFGKIDLGKLTSSKTRWVTLMLVVDSCRMLRILCENAVNPFVLLFFPI